MVREHLTRPGNRLLPLQLFKFTFVVYSKGKAYGVAFLVYSNWLLNNRCYKYDQSQAKAK